MTIVFTDTLKDSIYSLVRVFSVEMGIELETRRSATWKRRRIRKGTEPDTCFYVASAARIIGKRTIDSNRIHLRTSR